MTQIGEGVSIPPPEQPERNNEEPRKPITVRCSLFFDGTLNNRTNVQHRLNNTAEYHATKSLFHRMTGWGDGTGSGSYENDESNIAVMESFLDKAEDYDLSLSIYTEGPGSVNHESDKLLGSALGIGSSGLKNKVLKGLNDTINQITSERNPEEFIITKLTIDVFGFSRGAAGARYCIHKILYCSESPLKERMEQVGFEIETVEVHFAGLYDTVSSHGWNFHDVETLYLESVRHAKKAVHLVAADEYRKNFSLTNIKSSISKGGEEYYLPGAHSDIGGGYRDNADESFVVFRGHPDEAKKDLDGWISDGWYRTEEIREIITHDPENHYISYVDLQVNRRGINNVYCSIPLKIMTRFARESGIFIDSRLDDEIDESIAKFEELLIVEDRINQYIAVAKGRSDGKDWKGQDSVLRKLRHDHLHVSAKYEIGMSPRYKDGKRCREEYNG